MGSLMSSAETDAFAWQPLTPRGVAAFARAPWWQLLLVQLIFALAVAATVGWFLRTDWFPVVREAVRHLPEQGEIRAGRLDWTNASPQVLAEGHFLALSVDVNHAGGARLPAHVQVEFGRDDFRFFSIAGYREFAYPRHRTLPFNRDELEPWWGAWSPAVWWLALAAVLVELFVSWAMLSAVYCFPAWLLGFFANRDLSVAGAFKLSGAALMPGALFMIGAIIFYGLGALDLVQLAAAIGAHFLIGWGFLIFGVLAAPKLPFAAEARRNPFAGEPK